MLTKHGPGVPGPLSKLVKKNVRLRTKASGLVTAAESLGDLEKGDVVVGVTKGLFSMLDMIEHVLSITGSAEVDVSTWTMGIYDADVLWHFASDDRITRLRFLVDPSMFGRKPELTEAFLAAFGGDSIRAMDNHAKFTLIGNAVWQVAISSSMNLNRNARLENFVLIEGREVFGFYRSIVDHVFAVTPPYWTGAKRTREAFDAVTFGKPHANAVW